MLKKFFFFILICGALGALCSCQEQPPTHEHEFGNWKTVKVATCSEEGSMKCECSCGEVETSILEKSPHTLTKTEIAPTCTEQGYTENVCECGYSFKNQQTAPLGHTLTKSITKPTCEREGFSTYTCKCGYTYVAERTAPLGHTLTKTVTEPTCEKEGRAILYFQQLRRGRPRSWRSRWR